MREIEEVQYQKLSEILGSLPARTDVLLHELWTPRVPRLLSISASALKEIKPGDDLSNTDLSYQDLSDRDLTSAIFSGCDLTGTNLSGSKLEHASFEHAYLQGTNLANAECAYANFTGAFFEDPRCTCTGFQHTVFDNAHLQDVDLSNAEMSHASFNHTVFERARFISTILQYSRLIGTKLLNCGLLDTDLSKSFLHNVQIIGAYRESEKEESSRITLGNTGRMEELPSGVTLNGSRIESLKFNGLLRGMDLSNIVFVGNSDFTGEMPDSVWDNSILHKVTLKGVDLRRSSFDNATLEGVVFDGADIGGSNLSSAKILYVTWKGALYSDIDGHTTRFPSPGTPPAEAIRGSMYDAVKPKVIDDPKDDTERLYETLYREHFDSVLKSGKIENLWDALTVLGVNVDFYNFIESTTRAEEEIDGDTTFLNISSQSIQDTQRNIFLIERADLEGVINNLTLGLDPIIREDLINTLNKAYCLLPDAKHEHRQELVTLIFEALIENIDHIEFEKEKAHASFTCMRQIDNPLQIQADILTLLKSKILTPEKLTLKTEVGLCSVSYQPLLKLARNNFDIILRKLHVDLGTNIEAQDEYFKLANIAHDYLKRLFGAAYDSSRKQRAAQQQSIEAARPQPIVEGTILMLPAFCPVYAAQAVEETRKDE